MLKEVKGLIKDMVSFLNKLNNMNMKNKLFLVVFIILCSIVLHVVFIKTGILKSLFGRTFIMENMQGAKSLLLLKMEGCGHCAELQPTWDDAVNENNTGVPMTELERSTDLGKAACDKYNITGFPTILMIDGDRSEKYDGPRTKDGILNFLGLQ